MTPFHLVTRSPWPLYGSVSALSLAVSLACWFHGYFLGSSLTLLSLVTTFFIVVLWWRDVIRETSFLGTLTSPVRLQLLHGFYLFIASEGMLFLALFWSYFSSALDPVPFIGQTWPPMGIHYPYPFAVPLLGTLLLLFSSATLTYAHECIVAKQRVHALIGLLCTVVLGGIFTSLQCYEYHSMIPNINDGIGSTVFYMTTGLHGMHVIIGALFICVSIYRVWRYHIATVENVGVETCVLYWHFVDYIWILVYMSFYVWST